MGFLKVNSYLNQPLNAEIKIISEKKYPIGQVKVVHASREDYKKFNIEKNYIVNNVSISLKENGKGELIAYLKSTKIIKDPLMSFVLTLRWPEGNLSKEYNFFLYPVEKPKAKKPITLVSPLEDEHIIEIEQDIDKGTIKNKFVPKKKLSSQHKSKEYRPDLVFDLTEFPAQYVYGPIKNGNSITMVAQKLRADDTYSVQKISKLLYLMNPKSFLSGDINRLMHGARLKVPDLEINALKKDRFIVLTKKKPLPIGAEEQLIPIDTINASLDEVKSSPEPEQEKEVSPKEITQPTLSLLPPSFDENELTNLVETKTDEPKVQVPEEINKKVAKADQKIEVLKTENNVLKEQFDVLMQRMEQVLDKNKELDQKIKSIEHSSEELSSVDQSSVTSDSISKFENNIESDSLVKSEQTNVKSEQTNAIIPVESTVILPNQNKVEDSEGSLAPKTIKTNPAATKDPAVDQDKGIMFFLHDNILILVLVSLLVIVIVFVVLNYQLIKEKLSSLSNKTSEDFDLESLVPEYDDDKQSSHASNVNKAKPAVSQEAFVQETVDSSQDEMDEIDFSSNEDTKTDTDDLFVSPVQSANLNHDANDLDSIMNEVTSMSERVDHHEISEPESITNEEFEHEFGLHEVEEVDLNQAGTEELDLSNSDIEEISMDEVAVPDLEEAPEETEDDFSQGFGLSIPTENDVDEEIEVSAVAQTEPEIIEGTKDTPDFEEILATKKKPAAATPVNRDNVDIISQASVYFAYGKFDEAESLIKSGIEASPDDKNLRLKLFECYSKKGDEEAFLLIMGEAKPFIDTDDEFKANLEKFYKNKWDKDLF